MEAGTTRATSVAGVVRRVSNRTEDQLPYTMSLKPNRTPTSTRCPAFVHNTMYGVFRMLHHCPRATATAARKHVREEGLRKARLFVVIDESQQLARRGEQHGGAPFGHPAIAA